jgi:hypothetical protein
MHTKVCRHRKSGSIILLWKVLVRNADIVLIGKPERKKTCEIAYIDVCVWENNIKIDFVDTECDEVYCIRMAQHWVFDNTVAPKNFRGIRIICWLAQSMSASQGLSCMALEGVTFNCSWWNSYLVYDILYHFLLCEFPLFVKFEVITIIFVCSSGL